MSKARIREMCGITKEVDERIDKSVLRWFAILKEFRIIRQLNGYMKNEYMGSCLVGRPRKRWTDSVDDC